MEKLTQNDSFINGSLGQYKTIFNKFDFLSNIEREELSNSAFIRKGVMFSDRKKMVIPGKLSKPNALTFNEFIFRLENTLNSKL